MYFFSLPTEDHSNSGRDKITMWIYGLLLVILCSVDCRGFVSSSSPTVTAKKISEVSQDTRYESMISRSVDTSTTSLNGLFGKKEEESSSYLSVPTRVLEIPVSSIKQGGMVSLCFSPCLPPSLY